MHNQFVAALDLAVTSFVQSIASLCCNHANTLLTQFSEDKKRANSTDHLDCSLVYRYGDLDYNLER